MKSDETRTESDPFFNDDDITKIGKKSLEIVSQINSLNGHMEI